MKTAFFGGDKLVTTHDIINTMKVKVIDGNHPDFKKKSDYIVTTYNQSSDCPFDEVLTVTSPKTIYLIYIDGIAGGVIVDDWILNEKLTIKVVKFAAFGEEYRGHGCLKACITNQQTLNIDAVEINPDDPIEVWQKLGFTKIGTLGFSTLLRNKDFDGVEFGYCSLLSE